MKRLKACPSFSANSLRFAVLALMMSWMCSPYIFGQDSGIENRLNRALKLFPDSDADKDGKLSIAEARQYLTKHPELKSTLGAKLGTKSDSSSSPSSTTPGSADLSAGPRVFVCAHSFMIFTAQLLPPMVEAAHIGYRDAGKQMIGGSRVIQHWNLPADKNKAKEALREGNVDVLTLSPHMLMPDEGIDNFVKLGIEKNPKLRVLIQASWPARDGESNSGFTNEKRNDLTEEGLRKMKDDHHATWVKSIEAQVSSLNTLIGHDAVTIIPVCDAVLALREHILKGTAPGLTKQTDLFRDPLGHPLPPLASLVTYCHFAAIYQRTPVGLPVPALLKSNSKADELNRLLQQIAWDAVTQYPMSGVKVD